MKKSDIKADIGARFDAAREAVAAVLAGQQLMLAGQFLESELRAHGSVKAIADQKVVRILGPAFVRGVARFPATAREIAGRMAQDGAGVEIATLGDRIAALGASPVLISNSGNLETLAPDGGNEGCRHRGVHSTSTPAPAAD